MLNGSADALRRLYERFRTAQTAVLALLSGKPGEWLRIEPDSAEAALFRDAFGADSTDRVAAGEVLKRVAGRRLNETLDTETCDKDVRMAWTRLGTSKIVHLRFTLVTPGKKKAGGAGLSADRKKLPAAIGKQFSLLPTTETVATPVAETPNYVATPVAEKYVEKLGFRPPETPPDGDEIDSLSRDGTRVFRHTFSDPDSEALAQPVVYVPDLSGLFDPVDFERALKAANAGDDSETGRLLAEIYREVIASEIEVDPDALIENMRHTFALAQNPPEVIDLTAPEPQDWHTTARQVVNDTLELVRSYREGGRLGRLAILAPSPGTGKTRGMAEAAREEQENGRRVAYAVLSREQIPEACARISDGRPFVRLHVIEGRHAGNCNSYRDVKSAASLGYSPGSTVCPACDYYPSVKNPVASLESTCEYYASRIRAVRDRKLAEMSKFTLGQAPIIVTTHASLAIGTSISNRRHQDFWVFDTIFIDEDPTSAFEQQVEIWDDQLVYRWVHPDSRRADAHTQMTDVLRATFVHAKLERDRAHDRGYRRADDSRHPDPVHHRDQGSSYAGETLIDILDRTATSIGLDLRTVLAQVVNESNVKTPHKGELFGVAEHEAAKRFPHKWLSAVSQQLLNEIGHLDAARAQGIHNPDLAYKVHADLVLEHGSSPFCAGITHGVIRLHQALLFAAPHSNVVVGDAYADIMHYEYLFDRFRRQGRVDVLNHRAKWPQGSVLIRLLTRLGSSDYSEKERFFTHLDDRVKPILAFEKQRSVLFYTHLSTKEWLREWLCIEGDGLEIDQWAIEHWGSGRGKDIYRDFDTFVAVTEYVPNCDGLVHEANARVLTANPIGGRVRFWGWGDEREGPVTFAAAIARSHPALLSAFQRKATDELAQAVHRIRPARPVGRAKRAWVFGSKVPLSTELLAATSATVPEDTGQTGMTYATEDDQRGMRLQSTTGVMSFISAREMASAIGCVFLSVGCWSPAFCHALLTTESMGDLCQLLECQTSDERGVCFIEKISEPNPTLMPDQTPAHHVSRSAGCNTLCDKVYLPPRNWQSLSQQVRQSWVYREAMRLFMAALPANPCRSRVHRDWMPRQSHGFECIGNPLRLEKIIDFYAPTPQGVPF